MWQSLNHLAFRGGSPVGLLGLPGYLRYLSSSSRQCAPAHCTGNLAVKIFRDVYGENYNYAYVESEVIFRHDVASFDGLGLSKVVVALFRIARDSLRKWS